jgi:hypothetical protein
VSPGPEEKESSGAKLLQPLLIAVLLTLLMLNMQNANGGYQLPPSNRDRPVTHPQLLSFQEGSAVSRSGHPTLLYWNARGISKEKFIDFRL